MLDFIISDNPTAYEVKSAVDLLYKKMSSEINVAETGLFGLMGISGDNCDIFSSMASMLKNALGAMEYMQNITHQIQAEIAKYVNMISVYISEAKKFMENFKKSVTKMLLEMLPAGLITIAVAVLLIKKVIKYFSSFINQIKNIQGSIIEKIKGMLSKFSEVLDVLAIIACGTAGNAARSISATNLTPSIQNVIDIAKAPVEDATVLAMQPVATKLNSIANSLTDGYEHELMKSVLTSKNSLSASIKELQMA